LQPDLSYYSACIHAVIASAVGLLCVLLARRNRWLLLLAGLSFIYAVASFLHHRPDQSVWSPDGGHVAVVRDVRPGSDAGAEVFVRRRGTLRFWHVRIGPVASGGNWHFQWLDSRQLRVNVPNDCSCVLDGVEIRCDGHLRESLVRP
jgi:hypothetical protein